MFGESVCYSEFAVEVKNESGFVRQLDIFPSCEAAAAFQAVCGEPLLPGEYLDITCIDYDQFGNEISAYSVA